MAKKYLVGLSEAERSALHEVTRKGTGAARTVTRAHILLQAADGATDRAIAAALHVGVATVERTRRRCVEEGVASALTERPRPGAPRLLSGHQEAHLVALACSDPPAGHVCWTMKLLADKMVALQIVPFISDDTVRRILKSRRSSRGW
jgi:transposase